MQTRANVKKTFSMPKNNLVIVHDVYTGTSVPHLFSVIGSDNCIIAICMDNIVQLWFYIDCGYDDSKVFTLTLSCVEEIVKARK